MQSVPEPQRDAVFYCALALARSGKIVWTIQQQVEGVIAHSPSGTEGFGYDPIFFLPDRGRTMAELDTAEKNRLSARGKALADFRKFLLVA
jgi:XTP/dITP diphosphohydrolase